MRKALIIALGLASLGAIASAQPAFSLASMQPGAAACRTQNIKCNEGNPGGPRFASIRTSTVCTRLCRMGAAPQAPDPHRTFRSAGTSGRTNCAANARPLRSSERPRCPQPSQNTQLIRKRKCAKFSSSLSVSPASALSPACGRPSPYRNRFVTLTLFWRSDHAPDGKMPDMGGCTTDISDQRFGCQDDLLLGRGPAWRAERHRRGKPQHSLQGQLVRNGSAPARVNRGRR